MSVYRVEVQGKTQVWVFAQLVNAKNAQCAIAQVLRVDKGITAIRARREYPVESSVPLDRRKAGQRLG